MKNTLIALLSIAVVFFAFYQVANADVVHMKDGSKIEGKVTGNPEFESSEYDGEKVKIRIPKKNILEPLQREIRNTPSCILSKLVNAKGNEFGPEHYRYAWAFIYWLRHSGVEIMVLLIKRVEFDPDTGDITKVKDKLVTRSGNWFFLTCANPDHWRVREKQEKGYVYGIYFGDRNSPFLPNDIEVAFMRWVLKLESGDTPRQAQKKWTKQFKELVKSARKP